MTKGEVDFEGLAKLCEDFNGADLRNICTEGGMEEGGMFRDVRD